MHYIIGTSIKVNPATKFAIKDKKLQPGQVYTLVYISKKQDKVVYMFLDMNRKKIEVEFSSCREADSFIAKLRNEKIPDYDALRQPVLDNIPD